MRALFIEAGIDDGDDEGGVRDLNTWIALWMNGKTICLQ